MADNKLMYSCSVNSCNLTTRHNRSLCEGHSQEYHSSPYFFQCWIRIKNNIFENEPDVEVESDADIARRILKDSIKKKTALENKHRATSYKKAVSIIEIWADSGLCRISRGQLEFEMKGCTYSWHTLSEDLVNIGKFTDEIHFISWGHKNGNEDEQTS